MKTPALDEAKKPLQRLEIAALEDHEKQKQAHEIKLMVVKAKKEELQKKIKEAVSSGASTEGFGLEIPKEDELVLRRYMVNDSTVEKLGGLLNQNPNGLLLFRDELTGWLRTLDVKATKMIVPSISNPGTETARTPMIESAAALSTSRPRACRFLAVFSRTVE